MVGSVWALPTVTHDHQQFLVTLRAYFVEVWQSSKGEVEFHDFVKVVAEKYQMTLPHADWYVRQVWR